MSLVNAGVVTAPSSISASGGTALTFASAGQPSSGRLSLIVPADTDLRVRRGMEITVKTPSPQSTAPNGYTQARASYLFKYPKLLANGKITVNTAKVEFAYDVETTQTEIQQLLDIAAQICCDGDFTPTTKTLQLT